MSAESEYANGLIDLLDLYESLPGFPPKPKERRLDKPNAATLSKTAQ